MVSTGSRGLRQPPGAPWLVRQTLPPPVLHPRHAGAAPSGPLVHGDAALPAPRRAVAGQGLGEAVALPVLGEVQHFGQASEAALAVHRDGVDRLPRGLRRLDVAVVPDAQGGEAVAGEVDNLRVRHADGDAAPGFARCWTGLQLPDPDASLAVDEGAEPDRGKLGGG